MLPELESSSVLLTLFYALVVFAALCVVGGIVYLVLTAIERYRRRIDRNSLSARVGSFVVTHELTKRLHGRFNQEGIEINYPVRKLVTPSGHAGLQIELPSEDR